MEQQGNTSLRLATTLKQHPAVVDVFHPGLHHSPDHTLFIRDFKASAGVFSFQLHDSIDEKRSELFLSKLHLFRIGMSWGGFDSLIYLARIRKMRPATNWPHEGLTVRVSAGLEDYVDLEKDLLGALDEVVRPLHRDP